MRSGSRPIPVVPVFSNAIGRLDCGSGWVLETAVEGAGVTAPIALEVVPGVVSVEGEGILGSDDPFAWGLDGSGTVIAGAAPGDVQPPVVHLYACATTFGLRADADPTVFKDATIAGAYILDPWYPDVSSIWGPSDPPGTFQDNAEMIRNYLKWKRPEGHYPDRDGLFIAVVPTVKASASR